MTHYPENFDFGTADLEAYLTNASGMNLIYRNRMLGILASEDDEMPRLWELFTEMNNLEADEGIQLMSPAFRQGFITLYLLNGGELS